MSFSTSSTDESTLPKLVKIFYIDQSYRFYFENHCQSSELFKKRWMIWKKYIDKFDFLNFLFLEKKFCGNHYVFLINKKKIKEVVNLNIDLFQNSLGNDLTAEKLLTLFEIKPTNVFDILQNNEALLGILLGFGRHNALLFQIREDLTRSIGLNLRKLEWIKDEINKINRKMGVFLNHYGVIPSRLTLPGFIADQDHLETKELKKEYRALDKAINEIFFREDWFEKIIVELTFKDGIF